MPPHRDMIGPVIDVRGLFGRERDRLLELLESLAEADWTVATACPGWSVTDVAAHILGDDVGRLARTRDGFSAISPRDGEDLPDFIDRINAEWVTAAARMSPQLLISALRWAGDQVAAMWSALPPELPSEPVTWAGADTAPVWLDSARDLSEYWVHRQQIREAVGLRPIIDDLTAGVVIDTFMRALPYTLRDERRPPGTRFSMIVEGTAETAWTVERHPDGWRFVLDGSSADNAVAVDVDTAWRLCTRAIEPGAARSGARISGDAALAEAALTIVSIIRRG